KGRTHRSASRRSTRQTTARGAKTPRQKETHRRQAVKTKVLVCSCNGTVDLAAARLAAGLPDSVEVLPAARELCRRDVPRFVEVLGGTDDVVVACTQETALFSELADAKQVV